VKALSWSPGEMNALGHAFRRFRSLQAQHGLAAAVSLSLTRLGRSTRDGWDGAGQFARDPRGFLRGARRALPDNERYDARSFLTVAAFRPTRVAPGSVAVVVPVYGGTVATRYCLDSVLGAESPAVGEVIVVDDASPDEELVLYLDGLAAAGAVRLLRNEVNRGFVASANIGLAAAGERDVVLLNSDTEVAADWADRLAAHAARDPQVGTVTPFSNNATICSYPTFAGTHDVPVGETLRSVDAAFADANRARGCALPTAVGFCMFITRACLNAVGAFDEVEFGKGYGEENDFCLRASTLGWLHLLAADVYVLHRGEASFGADAANRRQAAVDRLGRRHPGYLGEVARFTEVDPPRPYRVAATAARFREGARPVVLMVQHALGSGTERHVLDLCRFIQPQARALVLQPTADGDVRLWCPEPAEGLDVRWRTDGDGETQLAGLLQGFGVARVHVHHTMDLPFDLRALLQDLGVPFDFTVHDFYAVCPRIRLAYPHDGFCGGPQEGRCDACLARPPRAGAARLSEWRERQGWLLEEADRVICPSRDTAARIAGFVDGPAVVVAPHDGLERVSLSPALAPVLRAGEPLRVALLGVLAEDKGLRTAADYLRSAQAAWRPKMTLIGFVPDGSASLVRGAELSVTGPYEAHRLPELLARIRPHVVWFPAVWPETYSFTLSEAMAAALPVLASDLGAFAGRLEGRSWSWLAPWDLPPAAYGRVFEAIAAQLRAGVWGGLRSVAPVSGPSRTRAERDYILEVPGFYEGEYLTPIIRSGAGATTAQGC
jgi:GT2 family glycosyltransferase/glycosyltransferase involved in cell wall biosynthesis